MRSFDPALGAPVILVIVAAIKFATDSSWAEVTQLAIILMLALVTAALPRLEDRIEELEKANRDLRAQLPDGPHGQE